MKAGTLVKIKTGPCILTEGKRVEVCGISDDICFDFVRKVARQIISIEMKNSGCINIHASSIDIDGKGVIFVAIKVLERQQLY